LSSVKENSQECHSKQDITKLALEDIELTAVRENASKHKCKQTFNASNCGGHVLKLLKEDIPKT
jgi:NACalpha-BTF3-like transcription factor